MAAPNGAGPEDGRPLGPTAVEESAEDLYHRAPCGYLTTLADGTIARVNETFLNWTGFTEADLVGVLRFSDLLDVGGRIFHETHYAPLLAMQGEVREIAFQLVCPDGRQLPVLVNSTVVPGVGEAPTVTRTTIFDATLRVGYEQELLRARERAEASEVRVREVADLLQRSLLQGGITKGQGFVVETRYRPAFETLEVGGDWYDSFLLADGVTLAISVGDVVGRGIRAACAMGQLRSALRALAGSGIGPGRLLDQLDSFVERLPDAQLATVAYAEINPSNGEVRYACAGHMPPLVVHDAGNTEVLWGGRSTPLGAIPGIPPRPEAETMLHDASRLLLYTDGLIERRGRTLERGLTLLTEAAVRRHDDPLAVMADSMMAELLADEDVRDDVCLLAACLEPPDEF